MIPLNNQLRKRRVLSRRVVLDLYFILTFLLSIIFAVVCKLLQSTSDTQAFAFILFVICDTWIYMKSVAASVEE